MIERSTRATATSSDSPVPSDSTTERARPPGAPMLPMASANSGRRGRGIAARKPADARVPRPRKIASTPTTARREAGREASWPPRRARRARTGPRRPDASSGQNAGRGRRRSGATSSRNSSRRAHLFGAAERPQREHERDQQAVERPPISKAQRLHGDVGLDRQRTAEGSADRERDERCRTASPIATPIAGDQHHLREMQAEDRPRWSRRRAFRVAITGRRRSI